jgi:hypothetical protein
MRKFLLSYLQDSKRFPVHHLQKHDTFTGSEDTEKAWCLEMINALCKEFGTAGYCCLPAAPPSSQQVSAFYKLFLLAGLCSFNTKQGGGMNEEN